MEEIVEIIKVVLQERISERIREQIVDVHVPRVVAQVTGVPKTSSRDRSLQCTAEQSTDVPEPEMVKQLVEVPETVSQERIQQRTVEQIVDAPVPQAVEELPMEVSKDFAHDRVQRRFAEQTIENPAISSAVKIIEAPVIRTPEETRQLVNTHVQHVVDTVEVEKPKITELTVQRKEPIIQEKMIHVTKPVEFPQAQFLNKAGDMLVGMQRHVLMAQTVQKAMEVPPLQSVDKSSNIPVVAPIQISPMVQTVQKTIETQQLQCIDNVSDVPVVSVVPAPQVQVSEKTVEISQFRDPRDPDDPEHPDL